MFGKKELAGGGAEVLVTSKKELENELKELAKGAKETNKKELK